MKIIRIFLGVAAVLLSLNFGMGTLNLLAHGVLVWQTGVAAIISAVLGFYGLKWLRS